MRVVSRLRDLWRRRPAWVQWFTPLGGSVALLGLVSWTLGWYFGWQEFMYIAGAALIVLASAALFTFGRTQLSVRLRLEPKRVVVGDQAVAELTVRNSSSTRMLPVRLEVPVGLGVAHVDVPSLPGHGEIDEIFVIPTSRRCVIDTGPVRSVRGDPLGLLRREVDWTGVEELFVHPRTTRLTGLTAGWLRDLEGQTTKDLSNSDLNFHALREYSPGDDRRHVHWRTSARLGKLMVRQFVDTRRSHLGLLLSTNPADYADADEFELAVSMVASLGLRALADEQTASLVAGDAELPIPTGQKLLDQCARVELGSSTRSLAEVAVASHAVAKKASVVVIAAGSGAGVPAMRIAADRFSRDVRAIGLRAALGQQSSFRPIGGMTVVNASNLDDLTRLMWAVGR